MQEISIDEMRIIELDILREIDAFCSMNHLTYYLCGGTLLGAVRHGGFIPWDDDIDICMPRPDYEFFAANFQNDKGYKILAFPHSPGYHLTFAKVCNSHTIIREKNAKDIPGCGVFVDVFPLDGLSDSLTTAAKMHSRNLFYEKVKNLLFFAGPVNNPKALIKYAIKYVCGIFTTPEKITAKIIKTSQKYSFCACKYVGVASGFYGDRETMEREYFGAGRKMLFEGESFNIPEHPDKYLKTLYGNYLELPPVEKRVSHHSFCAFWKE